MFPQPQPDEYFDGVNEHLLRAVPAAATRILEIGCARGRLGAELKRADPHRYVVGVEHDPEAAAVAAGRLDEVHVADVQSGLPALPPRSFDCVIFGDVLEHLLDPEAVLREARELLTGNGVLAVCVPNIAHFSIIKALLRSDLMYQPNGLLDATHIRFFTHATFIKMLLDASFLPELTDIIASGGTDHMIPAATPLLEYFGVDPQRALKFLDAYQLIFTATMLPDVPDRFAARPISFVACVNDEDQLASNLLRSPCLQPGTPHEVILRRGEASAADGFHAGLAAASHDLVVFVQQDIYLPHGWDSRFVAQLAEAERRFGPVGVAGAFGLRLTNGEPEHVGRVLDRETLLDKPVPLPARVDTLDEIVLAVHRDTTLRFDPALGFHLYGVDLCLAARQQDLAVVVLDAPCFHNSLFAHLSGAFHTAREHLLAKWPDVDPLNSNMGDLRTMRPQDPPATWMAEQETREERHRSVRADLADARRRIADMESSVFWKLRGLVRRG
ncbi:MAG: methyltransferase domain-containing protein [Actinobacteria bacterium]|nr:methyltransferase domain-containing protein [Actinomycetota bacterium]